MIDAAAVQAVPLRLSFEQGDMRSWRPEQVVDVPVSYAALR